MTGSALLTVGPSVDDLTVGQAVLVLGGAVALIEGVRRLWPFVRDFVRFLIEIVGAPERNGMPARPGLVETVRRLVESVEGLRETQDDSNARLARVEETAAAAASAAAAANDKVEHVSTQVDEVRGAVEDVRDQQHALAAEQTQIRQRLEQIGAAPTDPTVATSREDTLP